MIRVHDHPPALLLACLLGDDLDPRRVAWGPAIARAARERMVLRLVTWFETRGISPPDELVPLALLARERSAAVATAVTDLDVRCRAASVRHVFLKLAQSAPDTGRDLDLLVGAETEGLRGVPTPIGLDLQRGTLGFNGEHHRYAKGVLARAVRGEVLGAHCTLPCAEDQVILLVLGRLYGRPVVRLGDVCFTARVLLREEVDLDRLAGIAAACGLSAGLTAYLDYADQVVRRLRGTALLDARIRSRFRARAWGAVTEREGSYHALVRRTAPRLYWELVLNGVRTGDWRALKRVARLPFLALARGEHEDSSRSTGAGDD